MNYILLLIGFVLLVKGADIFIDSSTVVAKKLNISPLFIGLTIITLGTSAPEASVSIIASLRGQSSMAIGNIIGSNIFNILMVVGISGFIKNLHVDKSIIYKEFPFLILSSILLLLLTFDGFSKIYSYNTLSKLDGLVLLILFFIFIIYILKSAKYSEHSPLIKDYCISFERTYETINNTKTTLLKYSLFVNLLIAIISISLIIIGGNLVVNSATYIAEYFGISDKIIGLTIVSIGTSLPEFITSIVASTKGEASMALGSIIGSNVFNMLFIIGVCSLISPLRVNPDLYSDYFLMIFGTILTYLFAIKKRDINIFESFILILIYIFYILHLLINI